MGSLNTRCELVDKALKVIDETFDMKTLEDRINKAKIVMNALENKKNELLLAGK